MNAVTGQHYIDAEGQTWELTARRYNDHLYLVHIPSGIGTYVREQELDKSWEMVEPERQTA